MKAFLKCALLCTPLMLLTPVRAEDARPVPREAYWYISAGDFDGEETTGQLENEGRSFGFVAGIGVRPWQYFALEAEFAGYTAKYNSPPLPVSPGVSIDSRMRVTSAGVVGNAKAFYEFGRATVYAGAGLGIFGAQAELTGTLFGFTADRTEEDTEIGYQLIAGGDVAIAERSRLGIEYRRLYLEADFGDLSRGKADIGGDYFALTFRQRFLPGK